MVRYGTLKANAGRVNTHNIFGLEQLEREKENQERVASQNLIRSTEGGNLVK